MDRIIPIFLLLSGLHCPCSCVPECTVFSKTKSWSEAQSFCREKCVDLVTIHDLNEMEALLEMVQDQYEDALWIGLVKGTSPTWHWSLADERFYKEGERNYFNWGLDGQWHCGSFNNEFLYTISCSEKKNAVCFDEFKLGLEQYVLIGSLLSWNNAREHCRTHYTDLASVRNMEESQKIHTKSLGMEVWVGLFRDPWVWSDNYYSSFRFFPTNTGPYTTPDPGCGALIKNESGRWGEMPCEQPLPFLCKCPRSLVTLQVTLSSATGLDIHDPAVLQNLLKQMEMKVNEANLISNASLAWTKNSDGSVFVKKPTQRKPNC